jgi:hypothetical protein
MDWTDLIAKSLELANVTAQKYGPMAWETMLLLKRIEGIQALIPGIICFVAAPVAAYILRRHWKTAKAAYDGYGYFDLTDTNPAIVLPCAAITFFGSAAAIIRLLDMWNWVAVFYPELAIAHDILEKVTQ